MRQEDGPPVHREAYKLQQYLIFYLIEANMLQ
jgi:hypothetical protein